MKQHVQHCKYVSYGDINAHLFLWQKAVVLVPLWAILIIPVLGLGLRFIGAIPMQIGYGTVLGLSILYFLQDVLKRRIRMSDEYIFFGFRAVPIKEIISIDISYKRNKFLPSHIILAMNSAAPLKLSLGGITPEGMETILRHIQTHNSALNANLVLSTLVKCRKIKRKLADHGQRMEFRYHSHHLIDETWDAVKETCRQWARFGPIVVSIGSIWISATALSGLYTSIQPFNYYQVRSLNLYQFMLKALAGLNTALSQAAQPFADAAAAAGRNQTIAVVFASIIALFFAYIVALMIRPNVLIADKRGVHLLLKFGPLSLAIRQIEWSQITRATLHKDESSSGRLQLFNDSGKPFEFDLSAIEPDDRTSLLMRIEKSLSNGKIDHDLSQSMLVKSEHSYTEIWLQSLTDAPERKTLDPLQPGQIVSGRFEILNSLGVGGQGTAYLCRRLDGTVNDTVVLKETIIPIFADTSIRRKALERFDAEARLLKSLQNEGIVSLEDYFIEDHRAYLVLEHVDGCSLRNLVQRDGALSETAIRDIALQMCDILKFLHANSVIHRDFTPDNLIMNSDGKLKLIDFNVAQQTEAGSTGTIVGKHAYLPPEQFRGKATVQSDIYAFGATLFYLATGTDPEPISQSTPSAVNPAASADLDQIVKRATALQLEQRYKGSEEIQSDLTATEGCGQTLSTKEPATAEVPSRG